MAQRNTKYKRYHLRAVFESPEVMRELIKDFNKRSAETLVPYTALHHLYGTRNGSHIIMTNEQQRNKTLCDILRWNDDDTMIDECMDTWFVLTTKEKMMYLIEQAVSGTRFEHTMDANTVVTSYVELVVLRYTTIALLIIDPCTKEKVRQDTPEWFSKYISGLLDRWNVAICGQFKYAKKTHYCSREACSPERFTTMEMGHINLLDIAHKHAN